MKKRKSKNKKVYHRLTFWLGVLFLGTVIGFAVQFTRAWVEPATNPPNGNIAAPINTGASEQTKVGTAGQKADICVDAYGNGDKKCLSTLVTFPTCTLAGGTPVSIGTLTICKFPGASCPRDTEVNGTIVNWTQYLNYSETTANTCTGTGSCATSVTSGFHSFGNPDPATEALEAKSYYSGEKPWIIVSCPNNTCIPCLITWLGRPPYWGCSGYYCSTADEVWGWGSCTTTPSTCNSNKVAVGCIIE